jgi:hypothetical protein
MVAPLSRRSTMLRTDSAYGLAVLLSEIAEKMSVYTFSDSCIRIPPPVASLFATPWRAASGTEEPVPELHSIPCASSTTASSS